MIIALKLVANFSLLPFSLTRFLPFLREDSHELVKEISSVKTIFSLTHKHNRNHWDNLVQLLCCVFFETGWLAQFWRFSIYSWSLLSFTQHFSLTFLHDIICYQGYKDSQFLAIKYNHMVKAKLDGCLWCGESAGKGLGLLGGVGEENPRGTLY